jgi:hypothetical protein
MSIKVNFIGLNLRVTVAILSLNIALKIGESSFIVFFSPDSTFETIDNTFEKSGNLLQDFLPRTFIFSQFFIFIFNFFWIFVIYLSHFGFCLKLFFAYQVPVTIKILKRQKALISDRNDSLAQTVLHLSALFLSQSEQTTYERELREKLFKEIVLVFLV